MSTIVRYSSGSTYTLVPNKVDIEKVQDLDGQYHIPNTSIVGMMRLGLGVQRITVSGDALDMSACLWHDVVAISFDSGTSYQTVYFAGIPYTSDCWSGIYPFALSLLASPLKEQTATRYPTTGYKWGNQSITGISQAGNVSAFPIIHYLAPLFYAPLSNTLLDFSGQSVTFTRTASKVHGGVTYPINTPIFDNGLYLASDTAQDVATWTPPAAAVKTVAMQIKHAAVSGANLVTNGAFETNTTGWAGAGGATISRDTATPLVGTGSLKMTSAGGGCIAYFGPITVVAGHLYILSAVLKSTAAAGRKARARSWTAGWGAGAWTDCSTVTSVVGFFVAATSGDEYPTFELDAYSAGESFDLDTVACYDYGINILPIWNYPSGMNDLWIDMRANTINWRDNPTTVSATFPSLSYVGGNVVDVVVMEDAGHAVTLAVHPAGGSWTGAVGTLADITWSQLKLGNLEGSISNLIEYPYTLYSVEYQALAYSSLSLLYNTLYIGNRYAGEIVKGSDKRLLNSSGSDISALLGGTDIPIGSAAVTIAQSQGLSARWYVELKRTDV